MKHFDKWYITYFPVILVAMQVLGNILPFSNEQLFYVTGIAGINWATAAFFIFFTFRFKFCAISRICACAEGIFSIFDIVIKNNDYFNTLLQITVGGLALLITGLLFINEKTKKEWTEQ